MLILDSDERLYPDAIETIYQAWDKYRNTTEIGAISWQKTTTEGKFTGKLLNDDETIADEIYLINAHKTCEHFTSFRTTVFCEFPFNVFPGENFLSENDLFTGASRKYRYVYYNKVLGTFDYLDDGLTRGGRKLRLKNCKGASHVAELHTYKDLKLMIRMRYMITCIGYALYGGEHFYSRMKKEEKGNSLALWILCYPAGWLLSCYWKHKYGKLGNC